MTTTTTPTTMNNAAVDNAAMGAVSRKGDELPRSGDKLPRFDEWAAEVSQRTNRSLAGSRLIMPADEISEASSAKPADAARGSATTHDGAAPNNATPNDATHIQWRRFAEQAAQWGMIVSSAGTASDTNATSNVDATTSSADTANNTGTNMRRESIQSSQTDAPDTPDASSTTPLTVTSTTATISSDTVQTAISTTTSSSPSHTDVWDPTAAITHLPDIRCISGAEAMAHAQRHMPVTTRLIDQLTTEIDLHGIRIAVCLILEPKTAVLLRLLKAAGAIVGVFCEAESTDQRVADQLAQEGIVVEANASWDAEQSHQGALRLLDRIRPQIIIDDGASFARLAALERPELLNDLIGVAEETTSGVRAFQAMQDAGALTFPVIAVNDSILKTGFDNAHGTGETCVTTMQHLLGARVFDGARVAVIGYGPVGKGFATRIRALGAHVTVCDTDPVAALKAVFDGFAARDINDVLPTADIVVSATGVRHTITLDHMRHMHSGAVLAVIGGIANEIALDDVPDFHAIPDFHTEAGNDSDIRTVTIPDGPEITLVANGDGVNYTAGGGNPIDIMDLSFAVQASAVAYLLRTRGTLEPGLHRLDANSDRRIAQIALEVRGFSASHAAADNGYDWTVTRFAENSGTSTEGARI